MIVPEPETLVSFMVHVAEVLHEENVLFAKEWRGFPIMRPVWKHRRMWPTPISYSDLDQKVIRIRKPFMAALFAQAEFAHEKHKELPNPNDDELFCRYFQLCRDGMSEYARVMCMETQRIAAKADPPMEEK
eukprot:1353020-Amphidinium_carterae.1